MLPKACSSTRLPAVRTTKRSPMFWSKTISGAVRESAQPRTMAKGCCAWAVSARLAAVGLPWETLLLEKRAFPSLSLASAASASTEGAGWSAPKTNVVRLNRLRSEEHTSELQSHSDLVCRLLLEKT